jgi:hypothetical protein
MPTITDAASEIRVRRDMINPFAGGQFVLREGHTYDDGSLMKIVTSAYAITAENRCDLVLAAALPKLARTGHAAAVAVCPLSGPERTSFARSEYFAF